MVKSFEIIESRKRINRGRGRHYGEVGDTSFSLEHEHCSSSDDVLIEILALLPLKSIFRFKCVSKRWHGLISKEYLRLKVIERNRMGPIPVYFFQTPHKYLVINRYDIKEYASGGRWGYLAVEYKKFHREWKWSFLKEAKSVTNFTCPESNYRLFDKKIRSEYKFGERLIAESNVISRGIAGNDDFRIFICCSNGLLLCLVSHWNYSSQLPWTCSCPDRSGCELFYKHVTRYYIYNPLTKMGYLLPHSPKQNQRQLYSHGVGVQCPLIWRDCVALVVGMGSSADDDYDGYKVVRAEAASLSNKNIIELETFSSHTGEWQLSTVTVTVPIHRVFSYYSRRNWSVCEIKGAIYWMVDSDSFKYIFAYYPPDADADADAAEEEQEKEKHNHPGGGGGVIKIISSPRDGNVPFFDAGMGESVDGLLQVAAVKKSNGEVGGGGGGGGDYLLKIWVYQPQDCSWLVRRQLPLKPNIKFRLDLKHLVIFFHPLNPNILFISSNGRIFACHLNISPVFVEPLVKFNLMHPDVTVQPYLPPPWPISPFPAAAQKK